MNSQFGVLVSQIKLISGRIFDKILTEKNIDAFNGAQGRILYVLWNSDGISLKELSDKTGLAPTTLTSMIDHMEQSGLVQRTADKNDRRKFLLYLTNKAMELKTEYDSVANKMIEIHFKDFTEAEAIELENYLIRVLKNINDYKEHK